MSGWFAVKRGITSHPLFKGHPERLAIWLWLLDNAAWKDTTQDVKGKTVMVPRGSVSASERRIAEEVGVGYQVVRTFLARLREEGMILTRPSHGPNAQPTQSRNLISLVNWDTYQGLAREGNAAPNAELTQPQRTKETREQVKKEEESPSDSLRRAQEPASQPQPRPAPQASRFDEFWHAAYPHRNGAKKGKAPALKSWARLVKAGVSEAEMIAGAQRYCRDAQVVRNFGKDPVTWLNNRCWEDEIEPVPRNLTLIPGGQDARSARAQSADDDLRDLLLAAAGP